MDLSTMNFKTTCQSCGHITEITEAMISKEGFQCDACGSHISLWNLPDKYLVKKLLSMRKDELHTMWQEKSAQHSEFQQLLRTYKNRLDRLNTPYSGFFFLKQSRKEDLQDRIKELEPRVQAAELEYKRAMTQYMDILRRVDN